MGKRVLFTQKEIDRLSKTHEGRQEMNYKYRKSGVVSLIVGILLFVFYFLIRKEEYLGTMATFELICSLIFCGYGIFTIVKYNNAIKDEDAAELYRIKQKQIQEEQIRKANFSKIDYMKGFEFEEFCTILFRSLGYASEQTKKSGDFGADIILRKDEKKIVVQTKRYTQKVSVSAIQEITAAKKYYCASEAWVITNNYFTTAAIQLARVNFVKLIDRDKLAEMINKPKTPINTNIKKENDVEKEEFNLIKYNHSFSEKMKKLTEQAFQFFNERKHKEIYEVFLKAKTYEKKSKDNHVSFHFFCISIAHYLHALSSFSAEADDFALEVCKYDFEMLPNYKFNRATSFPTATILCIILTNKKEYKKVLDYCDFFIQNNINETYGTSFEKRKERIEKKSLSLGVDKL